MGRIVDVSVPVEAGMLTYPGDPAVTVERISDMAAGDVSNLSVVTMSTHAGTHVDPPRHFIADGATVDELPLDVFTGPAVVVDARGEADIDTALLDAAALPGRAPRILFKTDWSARWGSDPRPTFPDAYTALTVRAAHWLADRRIPLVGTDFLSIEGRDDETYPVHRILLKAGTVIVEGLDLREVKPGPCRFTCLPLKVGGGDGGPARAFVELG